jgi:[ribosomal protein S5]-alanine N-acetyltransferase
LSCLLSCDNKRRQLLFLKIRWRSQVEGCASIEVSQWLLVVPHPYRRSDARGWIEHCQKNYRKRKHDGYEFAIELKTENKLIGGMGLSKIKPDQGTATVGYWINPKYHQRGYGSEALRAVLDFAFGELKLRRIEAGVFAGNPSSGKLLERFGAKREGLTRRGKISKADGKVKDEILYGLLREEYVK